jgi:hypothetical protein
MADEPMNLDQVLRASYADAVTLGVQGVDPAALTRRVDAARAVLAEQSRRSDSAYRADRWNDEPDLPEPFGAALVVKHGGDLDQVLTDPDFTYEVQRSMELHTHEQFVSDEDGPWYETFHPSTEGVVAVQEQTALIRDELVTRGVATGTAPAMTAPAAQAEQVSFSAGAAEQSASEEWVARARLGGELAGNALTAFLEREGLAGTNWDPREDESAPIKSIDSATVQALEAHERRAGHFQAIATMAARYEEAVVFGSEDADQWRADVIGAIDDYGLAGTLVDPRGPLPAEQLAPAARADQAYLTAAARARIGELENQWATADMNAERLVDMYDDPRAGDSLRTRQQSMRADIDALEPFAELPAPDELQATSTPARAAGRGAQLDPDRIAAQIQHGSRADLWDESEWPDPETGEELAPFVDVALRRPVEETITSRQFVGTLAAEIAEARTTGEDLPEVTAADQAEALRLAPQVWNALIERGEQLPEEQPEWWQTEREALRAESPTLQARMEQAYLDGYNERIQTGLAYDDAGEAGKERVGADVLTAKVLAYDELGRLIRTLDAELPAMERYEEATADQPLTPAAEAALERGAHLAGRWAGLDAGADDLIASVDSRTLEVTHAPSVYAGDSRDALFNYLEPDAQRAQRALPQIERDNAARAAITLAAAQEAAPERPGVRDRLRSWREARREQAERTGDDVQRRREAWERGNGRSMHVAGTPSAAARADVVAAPTQERGLGR